MSTSDVSKQNYAKYQKASYSISISEGTIAPRMPLVLGNNLKIYIKIKWKESKYIMKFTIFFV